MLNPQLTVSTDVHDEYWEGCLSVPNLRGLVPRPTQIHLTYFDINKKKVEREILGFEARIIQHEYDHLECILFPMRIKDYTKFGFEDSLANFSP